MHLCRHLLAALTKCATSTAENAPCLGEYGAALDEGCATAFAPILGVSVDKLASLSKVQQELNLECLMQSDMVRCSAEQKRHC
jgi:hypothetical protein